MKRHSWLALAAVVLVATAPVRGSGHEPAKQATPNPTATGGEACLEAVGVGLGLALYLHPLVMQTLKGLSIVQTTCQPASLPSGQYLEHPAQYVPPSTEPSSAEPADEDR
jgi:hypothetical protein